MGRSGGYSTSLVSFSVRGLTAFDGVNNFTPAPRESHYESTIDTKIWLPEHFARASDACLTYSMRVPLTCNGRSGEKSHAEKVSTSTADVCGDVHVAIGRNL